MPDWIKDPEDKDNLSPLTRPNPGAPTGRALFDDGHFRATCPDFSGVGIMAIPTAASAITGQGPIPLAVVVCSCGVIKAVQLGGRRPTDG